MGLNANQLEFANSIVCKKVCECRITLKRINDIVKGGKV